MKEDYMPWMQNPENGLHKKKTIGDIDFDLQFYPVETGLAAATKDTTEGYNYFTLKINHKKGDLLKLNMTSSQDYSSRLYYYSYGFQSALVNDEGGILVPCEVYHFERSYDMTTVKTFVLAFPRTKKLGTTDMVLNIDASQLGIGLVKIKFSKEELASIPDLVL